MRCAVAHIGLTHLAHKDERKGLSPSGFGDTAKRHSRSVGCGWVEQDRAGCGCNWQQLLSRGQGTGGLLVVRHRVGHMDGGSRSVRRGEFDRGRALPMRRHEEGRRRGGRGQQQDDAPRRHFYSFSFVSACVPPLRRSHLERRLDALTRTPLAGAAQSGLLLTARLRAIRARLILPEVLFTALAASAARGAVRLRWRGGAVFHPGAQQYTKRKPRVVR